MSLYEKQKRIESKNAFKYKKPPTPSGFEKAIKFPYQKGKPVLQLQGIKIK